MHFAAGEKVKTNHLHPDPKNIVRGAISPMALMYGKGEAARARLFRLLYGGGSAQRFLLTHDRMQRTTSGLLSITVRRKCLICCPSTNIASFSRVT